MRSTTLGPPFSGLDSHITWPKLLIEQNYDSKKISCRVEGVGPFIYVYPDKSLFRDRDDYVLFTPNFGPIQDNEGKFAVLLQPASDMEIIFRIFFTSEDDQIQFIAYWTSTMSSVLEYYSAFNIRNWQITGRLFTLSLKSGNVYEGSGSLQRFGSKISFQIHVIINDQIQSGPNCEINPELCIQTFLKYPKYIKHNKFQGQCFNLSKLPGYILYSETKEGFMRWVLALHMILLSTKTPKIIDAQENPNIAPEFSKTITNDECNMPQMDASNMTAPSEDWSLYDVFISSSQNPSFDFSYTTNNQPHMQYYEYIQQSNVLELCLEAIPSVFTNYDHIKKPEIKPYSTKQIPFVLQEMSENRNKNKSTNVDMKDLIKIMDQCIEEEPFEASELFSPITEEPVFDEIEMLYNEYIKFNNFSFSFLNLSSFPCLQKSQFIDPKKPITTYFTQYSDFFSELDKGTIITEETGENLISFFINIFLNGLQSTFLSAYEVLKNHVDFLAPIFDFISQVDNQINQVVLLIIILLNSHQMREFLTSIYQNDQWTKAFYDKASYLAYGTNLEFLILSFREDISYEISNSIISKFESFEVLPIPYTFLEFEDINDQNAVEMIIKHLNISLISKYVIWVGGSKIFEFIDTLVQSLEMPELDPNWMEFSSTFLAIAGSSKVARQNNQSEKLKIFLGCGFERKKLHIFFMLLLSNPSLCQQYFTQESMMNDMFKANYVIRQLYFLMTSE